MQWYIIFSAVLLGPLGGFCLPAANLNSRDNITASVTSATAPAASPTDLVAAALDPDGAANRIGAAQGIPALTLADIEFILHEESLVENGLTSNTTIERRANAYSGPNTKQKWQNLDMDTWLDLYVSNVTVWDSTTKLIDSDDFLKDFWLSTGEEGECICCSNILQPCTVSSVDTKKARSDLEEQDLLKALFARQVFSIWQAETATSFRVFKDAVGSSATQLATIHKLAIQNEAPKPGSVADVLVPALGAVAVIVPALAPVAAILAGVVAISNAVSARDDSGNVIIEAVPEIAAVKDNVDAVELIDEVLDKRQDSTVTLATLDERVSKIENKPAKTWIQEWKENKVKKSGDAVEKAAKAVVAFKALYPGIAKSTVSSWDSFDLKIKNTLDKFPDTIEGTFLMTVKSWMPLETVDPKSKTKVANQGMRAVFLGGDWSKTGTTITDVSAMGNTVSTYLNRVIFMEFVKNQAIYLWRERFDTREACVDAEKGYDKFIPNAGTGNHCKQVNGKYEFRMAKRPYTHYGTDQVSDGFPGFDSISFGDWIFLGEDSTYVPGSRCYVQERSSNPITKTGFQFYSAALDKWDDATFNSMQLGFTTDDVFDYADQCQKTGKGDPFQNLIGSPLDDFYKPMSVDTQDIANGKVPLCLFNLPIFEKGDDTLNKWCYQNVGVDQIPYNRYAAGDIKRCGDNLEYWAIQADTKICGTNNGDFRTGRVTRPGCENHDKGVYSVDCPSNAMTQWKNALKAQSG